MSEFQSQDRPPIAIAFVTVNGMPHSLTSPHLLSTIPLTLGCRQRTGLEAIVVARNALAFEPIWKRV